MAYINEGLFNKKSKSKKINKIEPNIKPEEALNKIKTLFNKTVSDSKYKNLKKINFNFKVSGNSNYTDFVNDDETYLDIAEFDMETIVGKKYNDDNEDYFWDTFDLLKEVIEKVNKDLCKYGYTLQTSEDSEVYGRCGLAIKKGAKIVSESYSERRKVSMGTINELAKIASLNGIETSNRLRDPIVEEFNEIIDSLDIVDESVITKDISMVPVYKINEGLFKKKEAEGYEYGPASKSDYIKAIAIFKSTVSSFKKFKNNYSIKEYEQPSENSPSVKFVKFEFDDVPSKEEWDKFIDSLASKFGKAHLGLGYSENSGKTRTLDVTKEKEFYKEEGYLIELKSLKSVVESKECTLEEAVQEIRDVNYIGDTYPMYCVLPENINENMSLESFIEFNKVLKESGIIPTLLREYEETEFIDESAGMFGGLMDKVKIKLAKDPKKLNKIIADCEDKNKKLKENLDKFNKMSPAKQTAFLLGKTVKNFGIAVASGAAGGTAIGMGLMPAFIGFPLTIAGGLAPLEIDIKRGKPGEMNPVAYRTVINNTIKCNNEIIKECKIKLKEIEK